MDVEYRVSRSLKLHASLGTVAIGLGGFYGVLRYVEDWLLASLLTRYGRGYKGMDGAVAT